MEKISETLELWRISWMSSRMSWMQYDILCTIKNYEGLGKGWMRLNTSAMRRWIC